MPTEQGRHADACEIFRYVPDEQFRHATACNVLEYFPELHTVQLVWPATDDCPIRQDKQIDALEDPEAVEYFPAVHRIQTVACVKFWNDPPAHKVQTDDIEALANFPEEQDKHVVALVAF